MNKLTSNAFKPVNICEQTAETTEFEPLGDKAAKPLKDCDLVLVGGGEAIVCW